MLFDDDSFNRKLSALMVDYGIDSLNCLIIHNDNGRLAANQFSIKQDGAPFAVQAIHQFVQAGVVTISLELPGSRMVYSDTDFITVVGKREGGI